MNSGKIFHIFNKIFFEEIKRMVGRIEQINRWESSSFFSSSMKTKWHLSAIVSFSLSLLHFLQQERERKTIREKRCRREEKIDIFIQIKKEKGSFDLMSFQLNFIHSQYRQWNFNLKIKASFFFDFSREERDEQKEKILINLR